ncbi:TonB-dependent receptor [Flavobacterium sp. I3-2]|uniref:TonB-dependent receptor n=1 Tax=Flavobacterium sp. I3-2 TaxID=2748319 RepID=UPI0015B22212|nr:TonB-dependent receptor [Flavobacterium sp. I3-2]
MQFKSFLFFFVFLINFSAMHAQFKVYGVAYDGSGNKLTSAEVSIVNEIGSKSVFSDNDGNYVFDNIANGNYQLFVSVGAYHEQIQIEVKNSNLQKDIYLFSYNSGQNLDDMLIHVESIKSQLEKEGYAMNVIETKEAALRNIQTNELLDRSVGVRVRQNGGLGAAVNYNLNGMSGNAVRIFINGLPISTYGSSFDLNSIPPALIERIEVYKGVVPIHLSDDILGGAINIILKKNLSNSVNASVSYGSFNTFQTNLNGMFRNQKTGLTFKASGFHNYSDNDYTIWGKFARNIDAFGQYEFVKVKRFNDKYKSTGGRVEVGFTDVKWADSFMLGFNSSKAYNEIQHGLYMTIPYKGRFTESNAQIFSLEYAKKNLFTDGLDFTLSGMISDRKQVVNDTVSDRYNWYGDVVKGIYGEVIKTDKGAQQGAPTLNHINRNIKTFRSGVSYEFIENHALMLNHHLYDINRTDEDQLKPISQRVYATENFLQKNITSFAYDFRVFENKLKGNIFTKLYSQRIKQVNPTSVLVDGNPTKVDNVKTSNLSETGYGLATSYLITPSIVILFSAEKALRLPSENEIFGDPSENMISNLGLKPEISNNYNLGFKFGSYRINKHKFSISGSGFIRDTKDKIIRKVDNRINEALQTAPFTNLGKSKSIGFEAELSYSFNERLIFNGNLSRFQTLSNLKYDENGNIFDNYREQVPNEPFFTANASLQYQLNDIFMKQSKLFLNYNFGFVESFYTVWSMPKGISNRDDILKESETPKQFIQDLGFSYVFPKNQFVVSFDAKNIFNNQAYDNFAVQKPGRAFYLKINYTFNK